MEFRLEIFNNSTNAIITSPTTLATLRRISKYDPNALVVFSAKEDGKAPVPVFQIAAEKTASISGLGLCFPFNEGKGESKMHLNIPMTGTQEEATILLARVAPYLTAIEAQIVAAAKALDAAVATVKVVTE